MVFKNVLKITAFTLMMCGVAVLASPVLASADSACSKPSVPCCGDRSKADVSVKTSIDIGCEGKGNPIADMLFAIIRILSDGVGLVVVGSIVWAGIQYTASQGNPQETAKAQTRIRSSILALLIYIFSYAILNFIIPGQLLQ